MLIYSVCFYHTKNVIRNIERHISSFNRIRKEDDLFVLNVMIDSSDQSKHSNVIKGLDLILPNNIAYKIITCWNWGGTIVGLWNTYSYAKSLDSDDILIAHFEEDFIPISDRWLCDSIKSLSTNKYIYIGEHISSTSNPEQNFNNKKRVINDTRRMKGFVFKNVYKRYNCLTNNNSVYTDGGFYFSSLKNLKRIEEKIGIFHKGNQTTKYHHIIDGIILGEVGFPSQVYLHYDFVGLPRKAYFRHIGQ